MIITVKDADKGEAVEIGQRDQGQYFPLFQIAVHDSAVLSAYSVPLHAGRVYDLVLTWSEEDYEKDGFYGTASYVFPSIPHG